MPEPRRVGDGPQRQARAWIQHPGPGLAAFGEDDRLFLSAARGRTAEALRLVAAGTLTFAFALGSGQSSLLNAACYPSRAKTCIWPIYVRIDYGAGGRPASRCGPLSPRRAPPHRSSGARAGYFFFFFFFFFFSGRTNLLGILPPRRRRLLERAPRPLLPLPFRQFEEYFHPTPPPPPPSPPPPPPPPPRQARRGERSDDVVSSTSSPPREERPPRSLSAELRGRIRRGRAIDFERAAARSCELPRGLPTRDGRLEAAMPSLMRNVPASADERRAGPRGDRRGG
jgi:hypothetical protein